MTNVIIAFRKMFVYLNDGTEGRGLPLLVGSPKGLSVTGRVGSVRTQEPGIPLWFLVWLSSTHVIELHKGCVAGSWVGRGAHPYWMQVS